MLFETLVVMEVALGALLLGAAAKRLMEIAPAPELDLGRRAWVAARFGMTEAEALGPLFKHLVRSARAALREAHRLQEEIRGERERRLSSAWLKPAHSLWLRQRVHRSSELAELSFLVEQLEHMSCAIARYRGGTGMLSDLGVPMTCLRAQVSASAAK